MKRNPNSSLHLQPTTSFSYIILFWGEFLSILFASSYVLVNVLMIRYDKRLFYNKIYKTHCNHFIICNLILH